MADRGEQGAAGNNCDPRSELSPDQCEALTEKLRSYRRDLTRNAVASEVAHYPAEARAQEPHASENIEINNELHEHALQELALVDAALERISSGRYGVCVDCNTAIGFSRLQAFPMARRCIDCKRQFESQT